ncbi:two-component sensor histidine kinase [Desulfosarcina alkanivorans]|uniref:histidine kinase n=1 Tax=Desulfosarcina alkanivorans TaxID=571177 RepID=A0A5K7YV02_9BACT|nr:PAS domain-containing sensor histidine kinase [Desulfosarcina alkanivorans]BBO71849.1 two-component sensor histidine kinase [Desulfosarcina alkanivorans]
MTTLASRFREAIWPRFHRNPDGHPNPYTTFQDYRRTWGMAIFILMTTALLPLIVMTLIYYQLIETSIDTESLLRTERLASNARRAVTFFLEERLAALTFTVNEMGYERLTNPGRLAEVLSNLKLGFGGLTDLSVIADTGTQVTYAGPFNLEGKDYSSQPWFIECQQHNACVSEIFSGYRDVPHIVVAVKSMRPDGRFFVLRATLETERLIQTLSSYKTGAHTDIFLVNRNGLLQTPSQFYEGAAHHVDISLPAYSDRTQAVMSTDHGGRPIAIGYAFIDTKIAPTSFILMVVKQKAGMMKVWLDLRSNINWFFGVSAVIIAMVITLTSTVMVNRIFQADRQKAETMVMAEQNCQLASIGQLAAGVAHEINNPLALINETAGYVKDLFSIKKQYTEDPELVEHIDSILDAVARCGTITRQLLGFARRFDVQIQPIDLKGMVADVINFHKKEAEYRNIKIDVDIPESIPPIETDRGKLQQIILNLVNNAFQAIDNGCFLDVRAETDGPDHVRLFIRDNGCGIPEDHLNKVFEPFFTTKKEGQGTGLGLSITYGLVKKLYGSITVQSKPGQGTTFVVTLPVNIRKEVQP